VVRSNASYCGCGNTYSMWSLCCADSTYPDSDGKCNSILKNHWQDGNLIAGRCENLFYSCISCPQGTVNPNSPYSIDYYYTRSACKTCPDNTYVDGSQCNCQPCPAGTTSQFTREGTTSSVTDCVPCNPGRARSLYQNLGDYGCPACPLGKYADESGLSECKMCPAGKHGGTSIGASSCIDCAPGKASHSGGSCEYCATGKFPSTDASECVACSPGKYADTNIFSASDCLECNYGKYSTSGVCVDCVDGTFANSRGLGICSSCSAGQFVEGGYWDYSGQYPGYWPGSCTSCPAGKSSDPSNNIYLCSVQCAAGKYALGTPCTDCASGSYSWYSGFGECVPCSQNSFDYLTACKLCGGSGYKLTTNSDQIFISRKFDSTFGTAWDMTEQYYKGYWDYESGLTWKLRGGLVYGGLKIKLGFMHADCGTLCSSYLIENENKHRLAWFVFNGVESDKMIHFFPHESTQIWQNTRSSLWVPGEWGPFFDSDFMNAVSCQACPPGTYLGSDAFSCTPCPAGTYSIASRATSVDTCLDCPIGTVSPETGASACTDCQVGKYAPNPTVVCEECPIGTYSTVARAVFDNCTSCEAGKFSGSAGSSNCLDCNFGTFQSNVGQSACLNCPTDTYANEFGLVGCRPCADCSSSANTSVVGCNAEEGPGICECLPDYVWTEDVTRCIHACDAEVPQGYYLEGSYLDQCLE